MDSLPQLMAVTATLGALWLALTLLRRAQGRTPAAKRLMVEQRLAISKDCQLVLVRFDGREMLIATGSQPCTLLSAQANGNTAVANTGSKEFAACVS